MNPQLSNITSDVIQLRIATPLAPRRWRHDLIRLQADLEEGHEWSQAVERLRHKQPELGNLMAAALAAGHPATILLNLLQQRSLSQLSWQGLIRSLIYPLILLVLALVIGSLMSLAMANVGLQVRSEAIDSLKPHPAARIENFYDGSIGGLVIVAWSMVLVGSAYSVASPGAWLKLVGGVPVIGRPYRWMALAELLNRISVFSQFQPTLASALQLTAQSFGTRALGPISQYLIQAIERGDSLPNAIHQTIVSDARAGMALTLIDPKDLSGSTRQASQLVDEMIIATCNQLRLIIPLFIMLVIASLVWGAWTYYFDVMSQVRGWFYYW